MAARQMVENDKEDADQFLEDIVEKVHGRFINEDDFMETGLQGYKNFVESYIEYRYAPLDEEYDEAKYFTYEFDKNLVKKLRCRPKKKLSKIALKPNQKQ